MSSFLDAVRANCEISDARDSGVFSLCTLFLRLRNLYKWLHGLEPWQEEEPPVLLDWIAQQEASWDALASADFQRLPLAGRTFDPFAAAEINRLLGQEGREAVFYGAGYGRSLKAVFFLGRIAARRTVAGVEVVVLGEEAARELASPFALVQDGIVVCRRQPYRYALWDWIQEGSAASGRAMRYALAQHGLIDVNGEVAVARLRERFEAVVDWELEAVIRHEIGELTAMPLDHEGFSRLVRAFAASPVELVARAVRDLLADTHPDGTLGFIVAQQRRSSLGFYLATLDGMRRHVAGDLIAACERFLAHDDWDRLGREIARCRQWLSGLAERLARAADRLAAEPADRVRSLIESEVLRPLGLAQG